MIEYDPLRSHYNWAWHRFSRLRNAAVFLVSCLPFPRNPVKLLLEQKPWNMNSIEGWLGAMTVGATAAFHPQVTAAAEFTGAQFSEWETGAQDSYIQTSMTMAGMVLTRTKPEASTCINDWYFADGQSSARNSFIRETIASYERFHPSGVILAIILEECGPVE